MGRRRWRAGGRGFWSEVVEGSCWPSPRSTAARRDWREQWRRRELGRRADREGRPLQRGGRRSCAANTQARARTDSLPFPRVVPGAVSVPGAAPTVPLRPPGRWPCQAAVASGRPVRAARACGRPGRVGCQCGADCSVRAGDCAGAGGWRLCRAAAVRPAAAVPGAAAVPAVRGGGLAAVADGRPLRAAVATRLQDGYGGVVLDGSME